MHDLEEIADLRRDDGVAGRVAASGLASLMDMLRNYFPFYEIALRLQAVSRNAEVFSDQKLSRTEIAATNFRELLDAIHGACVDHGLTHTAKLAAKAITRFPPKDYAALFHEVNHLNDSLSSELEDESIFRIPPERKNYFGRDELFGLDIAAAFPSCARDIRKAGSCFALEQEDACVYHLMQVLERGLNALAAKFSVPFDYRNWQPILGAVETKIKTLPPGQERHFYQEMVGQFGFLKDAYRNHALHVHEDKYDLDKALSILNHVRDFMEALTKGGLKE